MNGNRYRNTRRPPWPQSNDNQRWQVRSNVCSFGYRRHELNEKTSLSTSSGQDAPGSTVRFSEDDNNFGFRRQQRDTFSSRDSFGADYGACEQTYPASGSVGGHAVERPHNEVYDLMKAVFDTDFRLSSSSRTDDEKPSTDLNWNPYRAVPATAAQQKRPPPILKNKISNPWKAEECRSGDIARRDTAPQNVHQARSANVGSSRFVTRADSPKDCFLPPITLLIPFLREPRIPPRPESPILVRPRTPHHNQPRSPIPTRPRTPYLNRPQSPIPVRPRTPYPNRSQSPIPVRPCTPHPTRSRSPIPVRPRTPHPNRPYAPASITCPDEPPVWETPPPGFGIQSYFESLRNREQETNLFGSSQVPQGTLRVDCPSVNATQQAPPRQLNFVISGSDEAVTFTDFRIGDAGASGHLHNDSGAGNAPSTGFQGTWRRKGPEGNKMARKFKSGQKPGTLVNGSTFETRHEQASRPVAVKRQKIDDARLILDRKRKAALEEGSEENTESSQQHQPANETSLKNTQQSTNKVTFCPSQMPRQKVMKESVQHNTRLWVESHFFESDPAVTHIADIHEVDESRLLPQNIQPEAISYVVFLDIDKRSCFEEVKQPFLSGTLLYLFYGDASVLLPTKDHPFYKNNRGSWVHFYPDCGTEYGSYVVAAPAVINWMDQKLPQKVKFLVHGHQKQLHLEPLSRKVIYYPTSRTLDVQLLNRMLKGVFDSAKPPNNTSAPTAMKTIVIRSAAGPTGGTPLPPTNCQEQSGSFSTLADSGQRQC
ncbi:hypothetical protein MTO96_001517 [Rhipicephalus appendiculatus]